MRNARQKRNKSIEIYIWDNGGKTFDRYSIAISGLIEVDGMPYTYWLGASGNPYHPQGFGQHCGEIPTREYKAHFGRWGRLGKRIGFFDLPRQVQQFITNDMTDTTGTTAGGE